MTKFVKNDDKSFHKLIRVLSTRLKLRNFFIATIFIFKKQKPVFSGASAFVVVFDGVDDDEPHLSKEYCLIL